jgi:hypothetical protein
MKVLAVCLLVAVMSNLRGGELPIITAPETIAGPWEAAIQNDNRLGSLLVIIRMETSLIEGAERLAQMSVEIAVSEGTPDVQANTSSHTYGSVFHRSMYSCVYSPGHCEFSESRLLIKAIPGSGEKHDLELDVTFDALQNTWRGVFKQDQAIASVRLERPHAGPNIPVDPMVGNWKYMTGPPYCLHARQKSDGELLLWVDERRRYGTSLVAWNRSAKGGSVRLQTAEFQGTGPHLFEGMLSADGLRIEGYWDGTDKVDHPGWSPVVQSVFERAAGADCSSSRSLGDAGRGR